MIYKIFLLIFICSGFFSYSKETTHSVIWKQVKNDQSAAQSQQKISKIAKENLDLANEYRSTLEDINNVRIYNEQLKIRLESQKKEKISLRKQIHDVENMDTEIVPLMLEMLDALEKFIQLDVPFEKKERKKTLKDLRVMMDRADVTNAEKYRRILEAYQIENEYGRTIGVYRALQNVEEKDITVDFLRLGRLSLVYQTLDKKKSAYWSQAQKDWVALPSKYNRAISKGIKIARNQTAPSFVTSWIPAPTMRTIQLKPVQIQDASLEKSEPQ